MHFASDEEAEDRHATTMLRNKRAASVEPASLKSNSGRKGILVFFICAPPIVVTCLIVLRTLLLNYFGPSGKGCIRSSNKNGNDRDQ
jgi:hypothetical protein